MPQSGTTVTVESVDHVFQTKMLDMLKQTGRYVQLNHRQGSSLNPSKLLSAHRIRIDLDGETFLES